jgi:methionyl-tRNA formyltransferase
MKKKLRIVFMGTPEFAVESLRALIEESGHSVAGVVTMPDKPVGKHQSTLQASPVKLYAQSQNLPILQPEKLTDPTFIEQLRSWNADLQIVVAFRMLPKVVWAMPRLGTFNLHASLLPQYRGAAPINHAIINGEGETGVTTFFLTHGMDTGQILFREKIPIADTDNAAIVHDRLMHLGARLVIKTTDAIAENTIQPLPQSALATGEVLKTAPKISKETCRIHWDRPVREVYNFIRGLAPSPGAWTELSTPSRSNPLYLKIFETEKIVCPHNLPPGTIVSDGKKQLDISATDGFLRLKNLQQAGKKRMTAEDFLRGMHTQTTLVAH